MLVTRVKTLQTGLPFVLIFSLLATTSANLCGKAPARGEASENARITISVYNDAEVSADVLERAENQASHVFRQAGIEVTWLNCRIPAPNEEASRACREAVFPEHLHLRIVRRSLGLKGETMGISFQADDGSGCYADLFYEPMEQLHQSDGTDIATLLGHVAAHEIGHLLLGANSHSAAGIMHGHWTAEELATESGGGLAFSENESRRMKERLMTAMQASKVPLTAAVEISGASRELRSELSPCETISLGAVLTASNGSAQGTARSEKQSSKIGGCENDPFSRLGCARRRRWGRCL